MVPTPAVNCGMKNYDKKSQPSSTPFSIKNLINIFEKQAQPKNNEFHGRGFNINRPDSKNVTEVFDNLKRSKIEGQSKSTSELEQRVSVKSLVCNFQKMSRTSNKTIKNSPSKLDNKLFGTWAHKPIKSQKLLAQSDKYGSYEIKPKLSSTKDELFEIKTKNIFAHPQIDESTKTKSCSNVETASKGGYVFESGTVFAEEFDQSDSENDCLPLGNGISPLPNSYKVLSQKDGLLEIKLPPPQKKSLLKKSSVPSSKVVTFNDYYEISETYNKVAYTRGDETVDYVGASAEYGFEQMYEKMKKTTFCISKEKDQKLGLQVYAVCLRSTNGKDNMAIYVKSITPNSLCDQCGEIQVDDLLVEINDISLIGEDISKVNEAIKTSSNNIKFVVARKSEDDVIEDVSENTNIR